MHDRRRTRGVRTLALGQAVGPRRPLLGASQLTPGSCRACDPRGAKARLGRIMRAGPRICAGLMCTARASLWAAAHTARLLALPRSRLRRYMPLTSVERSQSSHQMPPSPSKLDALWRSRSTSGAWLSQMNHRPPPTDGAPLSKCPGPETREHRFGGPHRRWLTMAPRCAGFLDVGVEFASAPDDLCVVQVACA